MENLKISLIIPVRNDQKYLLVLLEKVCSQTLKPREVIIVDSSDSPYVIDNAILESFSATGIDFRYVYSEPLNPGGARNVGLQHSTGSLIAFLDVKTLPPLNWLEVAFTSLEESQSLGVFGNTAYQCNSPFERRIVAATYGMKPKFTIPGSLFKREVFHIVGVFLSSVIAGEDTDWMLRARLHGIQFSSSSSVTIIYMGLIDISFSEMLQKWYRNYSATRNIPYLSDHKTLYLFAFNLLILFLAFNWNSAVAHWDESSLLYMSNVTKVTGATMMILYAIFRGIFLPLHRGVPLTFLMPLEWAFVTLIGLSLDAVKVVAFIPTNKMIFRRVSFAFLRE